MAARVDVGAAGPQRAPRVQLVECTGTHVPPAFAEAEELTWFLVRPDRDRVVEHTCSRCAGTSYELFMLGGGYFFRRTIGSKTWDTTRVNRTTAYRWWRALLAGVEVRRH